MIKYYKTMQKSDIYNLYLSLNLDIRK